MIALPIYFLSLSPMKVIIYAPYNSGVQNSEFKCSCFMKSSYQPFLIKKIESDSQFLTYFKCSVVKKAIVS